MKFRSRRRRLRHRRPLLQGRRQHRHPRRQPLDGRRARCWPRRPSPNETASGWQQVNFAAPVADHRRTRPTSRRTSRRTATTPSTTATSPAAVDNAPAARARRRRRRRQRRLPLRRPAASRPDATAPATTGSTSSSRRRRPRHHAADRRRPRRPRRGHGHRRSPATSTATFSEAVQPATIVVHAHGLRAGDRRAGDERLRRGHHDGHASRPSRPAGRRHRPTRPPSAAPRTSPATRWPRRSPGRFTHAASAAAPVPVQPLGRLDHPGDGSRANDADAVELGVKFRATPTASSPACASTRAPATPAPTSATSGARPGRCSPRRPSPNESATGLAAGDLRLAGGDHRRHHLRGVVLRTGRPLRRRHSGYFADGGVDNAPLHALANATSAATASTATAPPAASRPALYQATNYWVDVVFSPSGVDTFPPSVIGTTPVDDATNVAVGGAISATFGEPVQPSTVSFVLTDAASNVVPSTVTYDSSTNRSVLTPAAALAPSTRYTARCRAPRTWPGTPWPLPTHGRS